MRMLRIWFKGRRRMTPEAGEDDDVEAEVETAAETVDEADDTVADEVIGGSGCSLVANEIRR